MEQQKRSYHQWRVSEEKRLLERYKPNKWWGAKQFADEMGVPVQSVYNYIDRLKKEGRL